MRKWIPKGNSVLTKTFYRIMVGTLIPVLFISICIFSLDLRLSLKRLGESNVTTLSKSDQVASYMLEDLGRSLRNLSKDPSVVSFSMRPYERDTERNTDLCAILENLVNSYDYVENGYLYSEYETLYLDAHGAVRYGIPSLPETETVSYQDGYTLSINAQAQPESMYLSITIPFHSQRPAAQALLKINLNQFFLQALTAHEEVPKDTECFALTPAGRVLYSSGTTDMAEKIAQNPHLAAVQTGTAMTHDGMQVMMYASCGSSEIGWRYASVAPALSGGALLSLLVPLVFCILAACLIGLYLSYKSSKDLYQPLENLVASLPASRSSAQTASNEYQRIADYYEDLLNQHGVVLDQINAIKPLMEKKFLASLADDTARHEDLLYQAKVLELPFQTDLFISMILQIDAYFNLSYSKEDVQNIKVSIQAIATTCCCEEICCLPAELAEESLLLICNLKETCEPKASEAVFQQFAKRIKQEIESAWDLTVTIAIGTLCHDIENLPESCHAARSALAYKLYRGKSSLICFDEISANPQNVRGCNPEKSQQLLNCIRAGDEKNCNRLLEHLFADLSDSEKVSPSQVRELLQQLLDALLQILDHAQIDTAQLFQQDLQSEFAHKKTLSDLREWICTLCRSATAAIKCGHTDHSRENAEQIKKYIDENLRKDISLSSVSEYVNYSPAYVSKIFRQFYGTSYIDYLNSSRIALAKQLLRETELSVKEISFQVGFNNMQTFFRIFKKYCDMTPLQFRSFSDVK